MVRERDNPARGHAFDAGADLAPHAAALEQGLGDAERDPGGFLERAFGFSPGAWLRRIPGRETFAVGERIVVKRFHGDQWRDWWHELARGRAPRSPARREGENLSALRALGLCVPAPLAWGEQPGARAFPGPAGGRSALAMERLEHREHLRALLERADSAEVRAWSLPVARLVARLHGGHWFHRDLYLQHFAVLGAEPRRLALLDCGRARRAQPVPRRWIVKDLAALLHSAPANVSARARLRWLVLYARERGLRGRGEVAALAEAAVAKQRRMAAHAPRHVDPRTAAPAGRER